MSEHWKFLLRCLRDEPNKYGDLATTIWSIINDYEEQGIDKILNEDQREILERQVCEEDGEWALETIKDTHRCERCSKVFIAVDCVEKRVCRPNNKRQYANELYCISCWNDFVKELVDEYDSDYTSESEEESEEETDYEREVEMRQEWEDEMRRGR